MSDGSTDRSVTESEIVYIRFVEGGKVVTRFAALVPLTTADSLGVKEAIHSGLEEIGISRHVQTQKIVGLNMDSAAVNMGWLNGVQALFKQEIEHIIVIACVNHKLELALLDTRKCDKYLQRFDDIVKGIFLLYHYSPKKRREIKQLAIIMDETFCHFGGVKQICWASSQSRALVALLKNYNVTVYHLEDLSNLKGDDAAKAKGYLKELKSSKFIYYLHFMIDLLEEIKILSEFFQKEDILMIDVNDAVRKIKINLNKMKTNSGSKIVELKKKIQTGEDFNFLGPNSYEEMKEHLWSMLQFTVDFLQERFLPFSTKPLSLFMIFDFKQWPDSDELSNFGDDSLKELLQLYKNLLTERESELAFKEWTNLKVVVSNQRHRKPLLVYGDILKSPTNDILNILKLVEIMFVFSPSTAGCERGFSTMNTIKNPHRV